MRTYYGQRAYQGGLMITEATFISPTGNGGYASPGIFTAAQVAGFRRVFPLQPMPDHVDDPAHYTPVINPSYAMRQREMWRDPRQLALAQ